MKTTILIFALLLSFSIFSQQVLPRTNTSTSTNKSWQIYRQNSPTNVYGNSHVLFEVNYDSTYLHSDFVKVDILDSNAGVSAAKKYVSADDDGLLLQGSFDSLVFPTSQITNLDSMLTERLTLADGSLLFKPIGYIPNYTDVITGLGYVPLSTEVDGSATNEIELPDQTGNAGEYLSTNGTAPQWVSVKRQESYSGTTSGSGTYTVTFSIAYSVAPNVQVTCTNCTDTQRTRITSITTTGFTIQGRNEALGLIFSNANGLEVDVLITEK